MCACVHVCVCVCVWAIVSTCSLTALHCSLLLSSSIVCVRVCVCVCVCVLLTHTDSVRETAHLTHTVQLSACTTGRARVHPPSLPLPPLLLPLRPPPYAAKTAHSAFSPHVCRRRSHKARHTLDGIGAGASIPVCKKCLCRILQNDAPAAAAALSAGRGAARPLRGGGSGRCGVGMGSGVRCGGG